MDFIHRNRNARIQDIQISPEDKSRRMDDTELEKAWDFNTPPNRFLPLWAKQNPAILQMDFASVTPSRQPSSPLTSFPDSASTLSNEANMTALSTPRTESTPKGPLASPSRILTDRPPSLHYTTSEKETGDKRGCGKRGAEGDGDRPTTKRPKQPETFRIHKKARRKSSAVGGQLACRRRVICTLK